MQMIIVFVMWTNLETYKLLMKNLMMKNKHSVEEILPKTLQVLSWVFLVQLLYLLIYALLAFFVAVVVESSLSTISPLSLWDCV